MTQALREPPPAEAAPHILVVDDDARIRTLLGRYLGREGFRVSMARDAADARARMQELRNLFARHEVDTALYYLRRGAWVAAADRAKYLLETYPQSEYQNDAIAVLAETYTRLGNTTLADDAKRVLLQNDPQHPWLQGGWPKNPSVFQRLNPFAREGVPVRRAESE